MSNVKGIKKIAEQKKSQKSKSKAMNSRVSTILLCGLPGIGKTTLVQKICEKMREIENINVRGFYTEEVRTDDGSRRLGFDVISLKGMRGVLAREALGIQNVDCPTVGKYRVFMREFENIALPPLVTCPRSNGELLVMDELGKMELKSNRLVTIVKSLINEVPILATVPLKGNSLLPLIEEIKRSPMTKIIEVTIDNRDLITEDIVKDLNAMLS